MYILAYNEEYKELNTICFRSLVKSYKGIFLISNITPSHKNMQIFSEQNIERLGQDHKEFYFISFRKSLYFLDNVSTKESNEKKI